MYETEGVTVVNLKWCIAAKLGNETIIARIPVWSLLEQQKSASPVIINEEDM